MLNEAHRSGDQDFCTELYVHVYFEHTFFVGMMRIQVKLANQVYKPLHRIGQRML